MARASRSGARREAALDRLLGSHRASGAPEAEDLAFIRDFVSRYDDPFDRRLVEGHLTGSAFVVDHGGRFLLTHHRKLDRWLQLGGHGEPGESDVGAIALREAREESGLPDLAFHPALLDADGHPRLLDVDVHEIPARPREPAHLHLDLRFLLRTERPEEIRVLGPESRGLAWLTADEARRRGDESLGRAIDRALPLLAQV